MRYEEWLNRPNLVGRMDAVVHKLGGIEGVVRLLADEIRVTFQDDTAVIEDAGKTLFDSHGRCIPPRGLRGVADADYNFRLIRPERIDYANRLAGLCEHLRIKELFMLASEFQDKAGSLLQALERDDLTRNAVKGDQACPLPWCLPQMQVKEYGQTMEGLVEAAGRAYKAHFRDREFYNRRKGELTGQTIVIGGLGHERLLERLAAGLVVGIYFPNPFQGFSVFHQRIMPMFLPHSFCLAGGVDTSVAMIMWPDVLARDFHMPGLDISAVQWQSPGVLAVLRAPWWQARFRPQGRLGFCE